MHAEQLQRVLGLERPIADDHLEQHDADRVEIGAPVDRRARHGLLGRHVVRRADDHVRLRRVAADVALQAREPEIEDAHALAVADLLADHDVRGLHVAVKHLLLVRVREAREDLARDRSA